MARRIGRSPIPLAAGVIAAAGLAAVGLVHHWTREPAVEVAISWRAGTTWQQRVDVERRLGLARPRDLTGRTVTYDLVDTRQQNIRDLLAEPVVEASGGIDRTSASIPPDGPYGRGWMWAGSRQPVLRQFRLVPVGVAAGLALVANALWQEVRRRRGRALRLFVCLVDAGRRQVEHRGERFTERRDVRA